MKIELNPGDRARAIEQAAEILADEARREAGGLADLVLVSLSAAGSAMGIGSAAVARRLPVVELGPRSRYVRISDLRSFLDRHTKQPKLKR